MRVKQQSNNWNMNDDTIVARASAAGKAGIAVIRCSGVLCKAIAQKLFKKALLPKIATLSNIYDLNNTVIDEGIGIFFEAPHSFTGEDVIEFQCHGSVIIVDMIIENILKLGARLANPGEFTERAFLNGKIDLLQAEAVADLIDSQSKKEAQAAIKTLKGDFSKKVQYIAQTLLDLRSEVEASIDFTEEDISFITKDELKQKISHITAKIQELFKLAREGNKLKEGIKITIAGAPNVGKSTLINTLSQESLAIVTDLPGTTRDVIRNQIMFDGINYYISDTAGIREQTTDLIEKEGIKRTYDEIDNCDYLLWVEECNGKSNLAEIDHVIAKINNPEINVIIVKNKCDLTNVVPMLVDEKYPTIVLSAKENIGVDLLINYLKQKNKLKDDEEGVFIARRRHLHALEKALEEIKEAQKQSDIKLSFDLIAYNLGVAQNHLGEITGEVTTEDLLSNIFNTFCVGK